MKLLEERAQYYSFYRIVQILLQSEGIDEENLNRFSPSSESIRFSVNQSLGFPSSDIKSLETRVSNDVGSQTYKYSLEVNFMGLHGSDSPLPGYYLEEIAQSLPEDAIQKYFLDFFNHRLLTILYRIWRKYRFFVRYSHPGNDNFSNKIFATFGLYSPELRAQQSAINWNKLLAYSGLLSSRNRSPQVVAGILSHAFDFKKDSIKIKIVSFIFRKVEIPNKQRWGLGISNSIMASNMIIGEKIPDRTGKFRIEIHNLLLSNFNDFLPTGKSHIMLKELVQFTLKDQFAYELRLFLKPNQAPSLSLDRTTEGKLGWSSFLGKNTNNAPSFVTLQVRQ